MMKIINIVGARPNFMKIAPLMAEMRRFPDIEPLLIHTGQHYDSKMSECFFEELDIPTPDYSLGIGSGTHSWQTAQIMLALEPLLNEIRPDLVVVVGDVNSTMAAALVAAKLQIPLAHVEAGLRSFDRTMPEEINRIVTDSLADFLFTTERSANENLKHEGVSENKIHFVGNVMIDTLLRYRQQIDAQNITARFDVTPRNYALLTLHRPSNVDVTETMSGIMDALADIQKKLPVLFPLHPRTRQRIVEMGLFERTRDLANLKLLEPLGYLEFLGLMAQAKLVMTDSGGIQEETTILGVPCLTLRENTERPVTITEGTNELVGSEAERIIEGVQRILEGKMGNSRHPELWDGHAAERIVDVLRRH